MTKLEQFYASLDNLTSAFTDGPPTASGSRLVSRPLAEHWQATQFKKHLEATTAGVDRVSGTSPGE